MAAAANLRATSYLRTLAGLLRETEQELWSFFASATAADDLVEETERSLLRSAYRLDEDGHAELLAAATAAAARVGVTDPVTLYQEQDGGGGGANAGVISLPGRAHVLFSGRMLELLDGPELTAVLGHELAHHVLWHRDGDDLWVVDRLVHASAADPAASPSHIETARLVRLHTEVFADRGALVAVDGDLETAVAALVKAATGLRSVSGAAYLRQADEVVAHGHDAGDHAGTHPEIYVRAWALRRWAEDGEAVDDEVAAKLAGPVDLDHLDLVAQHATATATQAIVTRFLSHPWARTGALLGHARLFDVPHAPPDTADVETPLPAAADGLADYLAYVLLDLATVDGDVAAPALAAAMTLSTELGVAKKFDAIAAKELGVTAKDVRQRRAEAAAVLAEADR